MLSLIGKMSSFNFLLTLSYFLTKYFQVVDSMICDNAALQVCDRKPPREQCKHHGVNNFHFSGNIFLLVQSIYMLPLLVNLCK